MAVDQPGIVTAVGSTPLEAAGVCAVVVTYFPKPATVENLAALASQVGKVVIVDNGSPEELLKPVEGAAQALGATVLRQGRNLGIARALNVGLEFARERQFQWAATFDQDSRVTPGMIAEMGRALASCPGDFRVAIVTPVHVDRELGKAVSDRSWEEQAEGWKVVCSTMTSGNVVNIEAARAVGGFDESFFIDYVDHEFCLRLRRHGYRILEATNATLMHSLGRMEMRRFGFARFAITNHGSVRRYYISRNRALVWRQYWWRETGWVLRDIRRFLFESACIVLYEDDAFLKVRMTLRGLFHAIRNVRGTVDSTQ